MFERNHDRCIRNFNTFLDANRDCNETLGVLILLKIAKTRGHSTPTINNEQQKKKKKENLKIHRIITKQNQGGSGYVYITHFSPRDFCFFFFFFYILIKNCTRFVEIDLIKNHVSIDSRIFITLKFMCSTFSKFLFINLLYCNILLSQQKKKEIGFVKEYLVILESLGKLLKKKKRYVIREWSTYDFVSANRVECQLG